MALNFGLMLLCFPLHWKQDFLGLKWMIQQEAVLFGICDYIDRHLFLAEIKLSSKFSWAISRFQLGLPSLEMIWILFKLEPKQICYPCLLWKGKLVWLLSGSWMWKYRFIWNIRYDTFFQKQASPPAPIPTTRHILTGMGLSLGYKWYKQHMHKFPGHLN